jgi:WXXGXW repeat (2 copies)
MKKALLWKNHARAGALSMSIAAVLLGASPLLVTTPAHAGISIGIGITVNTAPPALPVYEQPAMPEEGYIWVPGYWAYADDGYYWVPGTWVQPPYTGALWTPGYWGWANNVYVFHEGYWGTQVGFYGGINYGYGYTGDGYAGGHWGPGGFYYNRDVNQFGSVHVTNVYNQTVINNITVNHVSYNGGQGGIRAQPTPQQQAFARQRHTPPVAAQQQHVSMARGNPALRAANNHGNPTIAATSRASNFSGAGVVAAHGAPAAGEHPGAPAHNDAMHAAEAAPHPNAAHPADAHAPAEHAAEPARAPAEAAANHATAEHQAQASHAATPESHPAPTVHHAAVHHAPVQHAPVEHAPASHPASMQHAPAEHESVPHAAPAPHAPGEHAPAPHPAAAHPAAKPQPAHPPKKEDEQH